MGTPQHITLLGLGAMGTALGQALLRAEPPVRLTVWNRTPGRAAALADQGAVAAATPEQAVASADLVIVCLYDAASVRQVLDPLAPALRGRDLVNLTTTTPGESRAQHARAAEQIIEYLDGAIMATPEMIGTPESHLLLSGSAAVYQRHHQLLRTWGELSYEGEDPGLAAVWDLAMLSGMYSLFAGFLHGAAMLQENGVEAAAWSRRAAPFLASMTSLLGHRTDHLDTRDFSEPLQSLEWTRTLLDTIAGASREHGVRPAPVEMVMELIDEQVAAGHGGEDFDRIIESMRPAPVPRVMHSR